MYFFRPIQFGVIFVLTVLTISACGYHDQHLVEDSLAERALENEAAWDTQTGAMTTSSDSIEEAIEATQADSLFPDGICVDSTPPDPVTMIDTVRILFCRSNDSGNTEWCYPGGSCITSPFGQRRTGWHYGTDLRIRVGDTINAAFGGVVRLARNGRRGYGKVVVVRHDNGLETLYGHLHRILVANGQRVETGEAVGLGGNTGRSTGPHLHFEVRFRGEALDPENVFDFDAQSLASDTLVMDKSLFAHLIELRKAKYCIVRRGDTLSQIAKRYRTTVRRLCGLNGITARTTIRPGKKIRYL